MSLNSCGRTNHLKKFKRGSKDGKRKRAVKFRVLDEPFPPKVSFRHCHIDNGSPRLPSHSSNDRDALTLSGLEPHGPTHLTQPGELASSKIVSQKRDLYGVCNDQDGEDHQLKGDGRFGKILEVSGRKKLKKAWAYDSFENLGVPKPLTTVEKTSNSNSIHCIKAFSSLEVTVRKLGRGEYGEICSGKLAMDELRPAKIVPLSRILKNMEQFTLRRSC
ncbi:uncharacterized protein LOC111302868 [Durio zibethinus]|uniref:Uncharacterized protein LOC111302868 n=1 Tax=Durio zibethinus TaxID=66656 RepID=A0A6P5ZPZ2_DURZI|nr:uncharacterized protein LOC111302868 [Durio zibethinus]